MQLPPPRKSPDAPSRRLALRSPPLASRVLLGAADLADPSPPPPPARRASDGIKIWDNFWSLSLVNFGLYSGDIGLFTWESPYMVLGGSGLTRSIVEPGWSDTAPVYFSGFNLFLGPIIGQSSNTALTRVRLFPSLGLDRLGVPTPPEAPPGYAPRPSFVPPGFMGFSPFEFNVFDRSFFALVEDVLGSL